MQPAVAARHSSMAWQRRAGGGRRRCCLRGMPRSPAAATRAPGLQVVHNVVQVHWLRLCRARSGAVCVCVCATERLLLFLPATCGCLAQCSLCVVAPGALIRQPCVAQASRLHSHTNALAVCRSAVQTPSHSFCKQPNLSL
jgi:hypothetical protein